MIQECGCGCGMEFPQRLVPNKTNLRKWVAALRSGVYKQVRKHLKLLDPEGQVLGYCCLGVACELAMQNGVLMETSKYESKDRVGIKFDENAAELPRAVADWLGVETSDPVISATEGLVLVSATSANDYHHWDFNKIADAIEVKFDLKKTQK